MSNIEKINVEIELSTNPEYYGDNVSKSDMVWILSNLEDLVRSEFCDRAEIAFTHTSTHNSRRSQTIACDDQQLIDDIEQWISDNWTAAVADGRRDYGTLHNYATGSAIRAATEAELSASKSAGPEGVIMVDGVSCYVQE